MHLGNLLTAVLSILAIVLIAAGLLFTGHGWPAVLHGETAGYMLLYAVVLFRMLYAFARYARVRNSMQGEPAGGFLNVQLAEFVSYLVLVVPAVLLGTSWATPHPVPAVAYPGVVLGSLALSWVCRRFRMLELRAGHYFIPGTTTEAILRADLGLIKVFRADQRLILNLVSTRDLLSRLGQQLS